MSTVFDEDLARQAVQHFYNTGEVLDYLMPAFNQKGIWARIPKWVHVAHEEAPGAQTSKHYWDSIKKLESQELPTERIASGGKLWTSYVPQTSEVGADLQHLSCKITEIQGDSFAEGDAEKAFRKHLKKNGVASKIMAELRAAAHDIEI